MKGSHDPLVRGLRVAVVGGGVFGATAAVELARQGCAVDLFERNRDLLRAASGINQYRLHRGYHYPRSTETALSAMGGERSFRAVYGDAVLDHHDHFYVIAAHDSLTTGDEFLAFCDATGLPYELAQPAVLKSEAADVCVRVHEGVFDPDILRRICWENLHDAGVAVHLQTSVVASRLAEYDFSVIATYSHMNEIVGELAGEQPLYQFEVCEKPVVRLPQQFRNLSIVVMDGPFMCVDPLGASDLFVLGNVVHALHSTNVGPTPVVPPALKPFLDRGVVPDPPFTKTDRFLRSAEPFLSGIRNAEHLGSMFTIRAVLPFDERQDSRPTIVRKVGEKAVQVFSGKIVTCVEAAEQVIRILNETYSSALSTATDAPG